MKDYQWELVIDLLKTALRKLSDENEGLKKIGDAWKEEYFVENKEVHNLQQQLKQVQEKLKQKK